jgi:hypothetical protein
MRLRWCWAVTLLGPLGACLGDPPPAPHASAAQQGPQEAGDATTDEAGEGLNTDADPPDTSTGTETTCSNQVSFSCAMCLELSCSPAGASGACDVLNCKLCSGGPLAACAAANCSEACALDADGGANVEAGGAAVSDAAYDAGYYAAVDGSCGATACAGCIPVDQSLCCKADHSCGCRTNFGGSGSCM